MSHDSECDITLYGSVPGAKGIICTCDAGGDGVDPDDTQLPPPRPVRQTRSVAVDGPPSMTLTGPRASALRELMLAEQSLRAAQDRRDAAVTALTTMLARDGL